MGCSIPADMKAINKDEMVEFHGDERQECIAENVTYHCLEWLNNEGRWDIPTSDTKLWFQRDIV